MQSIGADSTTEYPFQPVVLNGFLLRNTHPKRQNLLGASQSLLKLKVCGSNII